MDRPQDAAGPAAEEAASGLDRRMRWARLAAAVLVAALAVGAHLVLPALLSWSLTGALLAGLALGMLLSLSPAQLPWSRESRTSRVVAKDIGTLRDAFAVLQQQVKATISSSETAVMAMMSRMTRVHGNAQTLHARIRHAVERSQALSSDSLSNAGQHGEAVAHLAEHQRSFEQARQHNLERVRAVADQVRQLSPLAALIADISRQTNLLAINASIEAARAGREGAGFKVVAAEVRRLSTQTTEAARQITEGIQAAAASIDGEMARADAMEGDAAASQLSRIAGQMQVMSQTLGEVVPYLGELSTNMESGMSAVTTDILDTLGDMQFQDINRQLLEQINQALSSLSDHFAQLCELIDGEAPPPPVLLEELLARWTDDYVMHSQRVAHQQGLAARREPAANDAQAAAEPPTLASAGSGPRIEFF